MRRLWQIALVLSLVLGFWGVTTTTAQDDPSLQLTPIGTYATGSFDEGASEIAAYDSGTQRLFVTNAEEDSLDILDISDPTNPTLVSKITFEDYGDGINSVAVYNGLVAAAIEGEETDVNGVVVFMDTDGNVMDAAVVGYLPDMVTFTRDGAYVLVANEGEPNDDYTVDPEGSVSVINTDTFEVMTADFTAYNDMLPEGVRVFGPNATPAQDFEPEYIAVSPDSTTAYVTLQENNAVAVVDIASATVTAVVPLGTKDHSVEGNGLDASDDDGVINIATYPVQGMYLPDAIVAYEVGGSVYLITANEGDARDYDGYSEEAEVSEVTLDPDAFPNAEELQAPENLGVLDITTSWGDTDGDGDYDILYSYGARSFTIWDANGQVVFDSGDDFEQITAELYPDYFNSGNDENEFDGRSNNKGPEPEGVTVGMINERYYAFIVLERIGGVMVYDVTNPMGPTFVTYVNNRDFMGDPESGAAGDLGPEGALFIPAEDSPNGNPLLVVTNEISGTTTIYDITVE